MSEATKQEQQEPSMEEILASIRRIISDDGTEQPGAANGEAKSSPAEADSPVEAADTAEAATAESPASPVAEEAPAPEAAAEDAGDDGAIDLRADHETEAAEPIQPETPAAVAQDRAPEDEEPLDLTEAVQEDGTVIDLAAQRAAQARANAPSTEADAENVMAAAAEAADSSPEPDSSPETDSSPELAAPEADSSPEADPQAEVLPDDAGLELYAEDSEAESEMAESDPMGSDMGAQEPAADFAEPALEAAEDDMSDSPKSNDLEREHLVSAATEAATLATLSAIAQPPALESTQPIVGGERTLEQVVRDAIAEHLKVWLDANLPELVERVVRDEVRRLARRAEDI
ncbi:DUF2497 domain-containing protein [Algihabitans albus]|uniref:DUF2497 domain-containing protein n=1 Tax=Algihabitans albus TaxID=2164067 RepID=UPI0035D0593D